MGTLLLAAGSVLTVPLIGWVARDADRHHRSWFGWAFLVGNTSIVGLIWWLVVRRREPVSEAGPRSRWGRLLWLAAVPVIGVNYLIAALVVTFLFQSARVEGMSMSPTIRMRDQVIVSKLAYWTSVPHRGDIVMYRYPLSPEKTFVHRVIAQTGDTVRIVDGRVYVNEAELREDYIPAEFRSHDNWGPELIRDGYFVLGDYRSNSSDSRHFGIVPRKNFLGRVVARWRPLSTRRWF
jgi:signal peptidase I